MGSQNEVSLTIGAVQSPLRQSHSSPIEAAQHVVRLMREVASKHDKCKHKKIDLFVLPELCPLGYSEDTFEKFFRRGNLVIEMLENIDQLFQSLAKVRVRNVLEILVLAPVNICTDSHRKFRYYNYLFRLFSLHADVASFPSNSPK